MYRMKKIFICAMLSVAAVSTKAQTQLSTEQLNTGYQTSGGSVISIHDPSVVFRNGTYTIWGSHLGVAQSKDLVNWTPMRADNSTFRRLSAQGSTTSSNCGHRDAFSIQQVTKVKNYKGETVDFPNFDAKAYCSRYADDKTTWIDGDMWAPDIIYNESMKKWCMYMSCNGDNWSSIIILLTSSSPTGPFTYQGPVVMGGFNGQTYDGVPAPKIGETDYTIATGETTLPSRYIKGDNGTYWPNCIDPCVFYDEEGELWMSYGSWSGGIFILKLDKETGLRDYTYTYPSDYNAKGANGVSDPYFGKKIAGGYYVSGEGSYIQHIGKYYYLFMSYGGFAPDGGYEMRIFRSEKPDGPYKDASGNQATFTGYRLNYGINSNDTRGMLLMASYNDWGGIQNVGERAQGHNSACTDNKGRSFVVYHTKFNDGTDGHQVRVHQLFTNRNGWLVAAPFCYQGEVQTDEDIAAGCPWTKEELTGDYQILLHPYKLNQKEYEEMTPSTITLAEDGSVKGDATGTWSLTDGTAYMSIKVGGVTHYGVFCKQHINGATTANYKTTNLEAIAFTAMSQSGVSLWGYKLKPESALAWNFKRNSISVKDGATITSNIRLMFDTDNNTVLTWTSSEPSIISETGKYNPAGLESAKEVTLTGRLSCGDFFWQQQYTVKAQKEIIPSGDYLDGLVAYYDFNEKPTYNNYKPSTETEYDRVTYGKWNNGTAPTLENDYDRDGQIVHQAFGANGSNSYCRMSNPLYNDTEMNGFTVSAWIKPNTENMWDALWGFFHAASATSTTSGRLFLTGNAYLGFNDANNNYFDINYPGSSIYTDIPVGKWTLVTITVGKDNGVRLYLNGTNKTTHSVASSYGATSAKTLKSEDVVKTVTALKYFYLGNGSFWGSADACFDDLMIYNRELSSSDVRALNSMSNRVTDFSTGKNGKNEPTGIEVVREAAGGNRIKYGTYDVSGRRYGMEPQSHGIYIVNGKKVVK